MVQRRWVQSYPAEVPHEISVPEGHTLRDLIEGACKAFPKQVAFSHLGTSISYAKLDELTRDFSAYLQGLPGMKKGDRVALMMPNSLQYAIAMLAVFRAGFVAVNVNPMYTQGELKHQLIDSGARVIVLFENNARTLQAILPSTALEHVVLTSFGDMHGLIKRVGIRYAMRKKRVVVPSYRLDNAVSLRKALILGRKLDFKPFALRSDDLALLQYTGGTTGVAKGVMLTHANLLANLEQVQAWLGNQIRTGQEVVVTALPMYHIFCLTANVLLFLKNGGHGLLVADPRDKTQFIKALRSNTFTVFSGVNSMFAGLLVAQGIDRVDFSSLRFTLGGGAAVEKDIARRWRALTDVEICQAYGLTESSPAVCINVLDEVFNGSIGLPLPSTQVSLRDDQFNEVPEGEPGELCVKGPQIMRGYWNRPRETDEVLTEDGWLKTGDIARMDDRGLVFITDRKKDMILVSGFNVYPREIEEVVGALEGVLESAAVGVPNRKTGESVKLFVVRESDSLTEQDIMQHCRSNLTGYKLPRSIQFVDKLPKSPVGKVLRRALRQEGLSDETKSVVQHASQAA